jgi:hypothetical protein
MAKTKPTHRNEESNITLRSLPTLQVKGIQEYAGFRGLKNQTTDALARQALVESQLPDSLGLIYTYTSAAHDQGTLQEALQSITLNSVRLLTTSCC